MPSPKPVPPVAPGQQAPIAAVSPDTAGASGELPDAADLGLSKPPRIPQTTMKSKQACQSALFCLMIWPLASERMTVTK